MLIDTFFTIEKFNESAGFIRASISLIQDHPVYQGHFPGMPVVPGVCQVGIIKEVMCHNKPGTYLLTGSKSCKFLQMINPLETESFLCEITWKHNEKQQILFSGSLFNAKHTFLKMKGILDRQDG